MKLVFDAGALVALERNDDAIWRRFKTATVAGVRIVTHAGILGQVWRGHGPRHARLSAALASIDVLPLDESLGRAAGELLAANRSTDVIDAALVLLADRDDAIYTSDVDDIEALAGAARLEIDLIDVSSAARRRSR